MSPIDRAVGLLCRHLDGFSTSQQQEIEQSTRALLTGQHLPARLREVLSLGALAIGLRGRRGAGAAASTPDAWRSGAWIGSLVLLAAVTTDAWSGAFGSASTLAGSRPAGAVAAIASSVALGFAATGRRVASAAAVVAAAVPLFAGDATSAALVPPAITFLVVLAGVLAGDAGRARRHGTRSRAALAALAPVAAAAVLLPLRSVTLGWLVATLIVPVGFVLLSPLIPRLGAAAVVLWGWRFVASEPGGLGRALAGLNDDHNPYRLLARWVVMATGVWLALAITRRSVRRSAML